eukprot:scaffold3236_cov66-Cylindrotheca_fusiformis.AAC.17
MNPSTATSSSVSPSLYNNNASDTKVKGRYVLPSTTGEGSKKKEYPKEKYYSMQKLHKDVAATSPRGVILLSQKAANVDGAPAVNDLTRLMDSSTLSNAAGPQTLLVSQDTAANTCLYFENHHSNPNNKNNNNDDDASSSDDDDIDDDEDSTYYDFLNDLPSTRLGAGGQDESSVRSLYLRRSSSSEASDFEEQSIDEDDDFWKNHE